MRSMLCHERSLHGMSRSAGSEELWMPPDLVASPGAMQPRLLLPHEA